MERGEVVGVVSGPPTDLGIQLRAEHGVQHDGILGRLNVRRDDDRARGDLGSRVCVGMENHTDGRERKWLTSSSKNMAADTDAGLPRGILTFSHFS